MKILATKKKSSLADTMAKAVDAIAKRKANAVCWGYMYEPEVPQKLKKESK